MDTSVKIDKWLEVETLEEILEELSLSPEQVLLLLWHGGQLNFPPYLEDDLSVFNETYDD